jgi:hypothetical protein
MVAFNSQFKPAERPPEHILEWCRNHMRIIHDGGVWGIPRSGTTFKVDKTNKRLIEIIPGHDDGADFNATKHVFSFIGWDVITEKEADEQKQAPQN